MNTVQNYLKTTLTVLGSITIDASRNWRKMLGKSPNSMYKTHLKIGKKVLRKS